MAKVSSLRFNASVWEKYKTPPHMILDVTLNYEITVN